jgi:hypothetical protein
VSTSWISKLVPAFTTISWFSANEGSMSWWLATNHTIKRVNQNQNPVSRVLKTSSISTHVKASGQHGLSSLLIAYTSLLIAYNLIRDEVTILALSTKDGKGSRRHRAFYCSFTQEALLSLCNLASWACSVKLFWRERRQFCQQRVGRSKSLV